MAKTSDRGHWSMDEAQASPLAPLKRGVSLNIAARVTMAKEKVDLNVPPFAERSCSTSVLD
eukprot:2882746-Prorocentrum_lima.AAC.1